MHPPKKQRIIGKREEVTQVETRKKRPKKKERDEEDKLRLKLREKVAKTSMVIDDFECNFKIENNPKPKNCFQKFGNILEQFWKSQIPTNLMMITQD